MYDNEEFPTINSLQNTLGKKSIKFLGSTGKVEVELPGSLLMEMIVTLIKN